MLHLQRCLFLYFLYIFLSFCHTYKFVCMRGICCYVLPSVRSGDSHISPLLILYKICAIYGKQQFAVFLALLMFQPRYPEAVSS